MSHYASFHNKQVPPPMIAHVGPVYASGALPTNMVLVLEDYLKQAPPPVLGHAGPVYASGALSPNRVSVLEDYYYPEAKDNIMSAPGMVKKEVEKDRKKPEAGVNIPWLKQAVDQSVFDDDNGELTPVENMDKLEDIHATTKVQHMVPSVS